MDRRSGRKMEKRLETKQMKLTKQTLKQIIKEELNKVISEAGYRPISPEEQETIDAQRSKEREEEEVQTIRDAVGQGRPFWIHEMAKEFEQAFRGGDAFNRDPEQEAILDKYAKHHVIRTLEKWWHATLSGKVSYTKKKQIFSFLNPGDGGRLSAVWNELAHLTDKDEKWNDIEKKAMDHRSEGLAKSYWT